MKRLKINPHNLGFFIIEIESTQNAMTLMNEYFYTDLKNTKKTVSA